MCFACNNLKGNLDLLLLLCDVEYMRPQYHTLFSHENGYSTATAPRGRYRREGAIVILDRVTPSIIGFLRLRYLDNPDCLEGDIEDLFLIDGEGLTEEDNLREF